jgi:hypothetical protein
MDATANRMDADRAASMKRTGTVVSVLIGAAIIAAVTMATTTIGSDPALGGALIAACLPAAGVLSYGHVLGAAFTPAAAKRGVAERALEAMMQVLSCTLLIVVAKPDIL